ncbi:MAG: molybdopterin molybdotransferase MoeA, partial [Alphaproteobacteria bacterium]|nr:molybdopterin molybdotransferase MoeA [Alphaproteobacteria bacterium]
MISFETAQRIIRERASTYRLDTEVIALHEAVGRVCAEDVLAPLSIQPFDNSAMDGFAVRMCDLEGASEEAPVVLEKSGVIAAGDPVPEEALRAEKCIHIMTGAPVPKGTDAVVPIENVDVQDQKITFKSVPKLMANIRRAGEDFQKGDEILKTGDTLGVAHILPLATLGISQLRVFKKPKVAFMATGREIVDDLSTPLESGQIYNSNRPYALAMLEALGCDVLPCETVRDDLEVFCKELKNLMSEKCDIIISSGAVSAGEFDFVKEGLEKIGADIIFHKVKLKPGKPNLFAILPNGAFYFGLPGNPVASAVGLRFFVVSALRAMMGQEPEKPLHARAMTKFIKKSGLHMILKGKSESWEDGTRSVDILDGQASFM